MSKKYYPSRITQCTRADAFLKNDAKLSFWQQHYDKIKN
jgi:hypothetical protein